MRMYKLLLCEYLKPIIPKNGRNVDTKYKYLIELKSQKIFSKVGEKFSFGQIGIH